MSWACPAGPCCYRVTGSGILGTQVMRYGQGQIRTRVRTGKDGQGQVAGKDGQGRAWARMGRDNDGLGQLELDVNLSG